MCYDPSCLNIRYACKNSVEPDKTGQNAAFDLGLHCLPFIQH